jgi:uncharacterized protein YcbX
MSTPAVRIESLASYPIKGCRRIAWETADLLPNGLPYDREWMLVDENNAFISQRTDPVLATVAPAFADGALTIEAPGLDRLDLPLDRRGERRRVRVWRDEVDAHDMGDDAADWFTAVLGRPVRLVRYAPDAARLADPAYTGDARAPVRFPDAYPVLVTLTASLAALNAELDTPLPMTRFRPSVVLDGLGAFDEDRIDTLRIGDAELRCVKPCARCIVTTTDQLTGERAIEPMPTLKRLRWNRELKGVTFGENAVVLRPGRLRVGDAVRVSWRTR